jgi:hypothetical protein
VLPGVTHVTHVARFAATPESQRENEERLAHTIASKAAAAVRVSIRGRLALLIGRQRVDICVYGLTPPQAFAHHLAPQHAPNQPSMHMQSCLSLATIEMGALECKPERERNSMRLQACFVCKSLQCHFDEMKPYSRNQCMHASQHTHARLCFACVNHTTLT